LISLDNEDNHIMDLTKIRQLLTDDLNQLNSLIEQRLHSHIPLINELAQHIIHSGGKRIRPMLLLLCSKAFNYSGNEHIELAAVIEFIHTATLLHDDVVDESSLRRGQATANNIWGDHAPVLVGDFLYSRGMLLALETDDFELLKIVSNAVKEMSEGELMQIEKARKLDITDEIYFEIIKQKTASLIASCCKVGAASVGASQEIVNKFGEFGEKVGIAFQIKDDLFDYGNGEKIAKPTGIDIKEKKMTLPLIYALSQAPKKVQRKIIQIVKKNNNQKEKVQEVIDFVISSGGIEYASRKMHEYKNEALNLLSGLPQNEANESLKNLVLYTTERES